VEETLLCAARLRVDSANVDIPALVASLLQELGLRDCTHTRIGSTRARGVSGGEKRRVSVGCALVASPRCLFADEATTGLDAQSARNLVLTFQDLTRRGRTVVATLHQPRADVFACFDTTVLLASRGRVVYFGTARDDMLRYFADARGLPCPENTNPADHFLDVSSIDVRSADAEKITAARVESLVNAWREHTADTASASSGCATGDEEPQSRMLFGHASGHRPAGAPGLVAQTRVLLWRNTLNSSRDVLTLAGLFMESVVIAVLIGAVFFNLDGSASSMISRGTLVYLVGSLQTYQFLVFSIYILTAELTVFDHDTRDGMYTTLPWLLARFGVMAPQMVVFPTLFSIIVYYMAALNPTTAGILIFIATMIAVHWIGFAIALFACACLRSFSAASLLANSLYTFFGLVSGLLVQLDTVPIWLAWLERISFINFSFRILALNEFHNRSWPCPYATLQPISPLNASAAVAQQLKLPPVCASFDGNTRLQQLGIPADYTDPAVALAITFAVFAILGGVILKLRPAVTTRLAAASAAVGTPAPSTPSIATAYGNAITNGHDHKLTEKGHSHAGTNGDVVVSSLCDSAPDELHFRQFAPVTVRTHSLGLRLDPSSWRLGRTAPEKHILRDISLEFQPGTLTGIMGASGSGKSSLLNVLSCRLRPGEGYLVSGVVKFNDRQLAPAACRAAVGYVTQHDALLPLLTVTEALLFSAQLRLPTWLDDDVKRQRVQTVLLDLGLRDCGDTLIGADVSEAAAGGGGGATAGGGAGGGGTSAGKRGVSGGERRRVSVGVQLLTDPAVLLLDEPTSGLDAFTAFNMGVTLRRLAAEEKRTVVATMHQPREGLYAMFDQLVLMAHGRLGYAGPGGDAALAYFAAGPLELHYPARTNPADFLVDCCCVNTRNANSETESRALVERILDAYAQRRGKACDDAERGGAVEAESGESVALGIERPMAPLQVTLPLLVARSWRNTSRDPGQAIARVMQILSFGAILCCFYTRLGHDDTRSVQNRMGLLYELMALVFVGMLNCIAVFPAERNVFFRETADGQYSTLSFVSCYSLLELPGEIVGSLVFAIMMCPIAGLKDTAASFFSMAYVVFCITSAGESVGIAFCAAIYHVGFSVTIVSIFLSFFTVMAGFFAPGMPYWLQVINHCSVLKYGGNVLVVSEMRNLKFDCAAASGQRGSPLCALPTGEAVMELYKFEPNNFTRDLWICGLLTVLYRLAAGGLLHALRNRHL